MDTQVQLFLSEEGADAERLDGLAGRLRQELLELDVDDVRPLPGAEPPPGSRAFDVVEAGALLVSLGSSVTALRDIVTVVRGWLGRHETRPSIRLVMDDDVLEISEASPSQVAESFDLFVRRHAPAADASTDDASADAADGTSDGVSADQSGVRP